MEQPRPVSNNGVAKPARRPGAEGPLRRFARLALDAVLPPQCLACGGAVDSPHVLCPACWSRARFLAPPQCPACGIPFDFDPGAGALCGACARERPIYGRARAVFVYDEASRRLVLAFKHADRTDAAPSYGRWLARAGAELVADAEVAVPVPLHWTRLFQRRYNQSALLAHALGRATGPPVAAAALARTRRTPSQGRLGPAERRRNVRGAFAVREVRRPEIAGRRVLLVDDVLTTGATAQACASALLAAGAVAVDVLTLARVVRPAP